MMKRRMKLGATLALTGAMTLLAWTAIGRAAHKDKLVSTIAFSSTRDDPTNPVPILASEIYLMDEDGTNLRRLTNNMTGEGLAALSPDGKKIVFDSTRNRIAGEPLNTSDLFFRRTNGEEETWLTRGSSASWSPDSKNIAFHASASGTGLPIKPDPGAATSDSDIFVLRVDGDGTREHIPANITNSPLAIDDDPDWSPDGLKILYTSHSIFDNPINSVTAEIYVMNADGSGVPVRLTHNNVEERAPSWSPNGSLIVFMRREISSFEVFVMNADGSDPVRLTNNAVFEGTPTFSPDGQKIVFHRTMPPTQQIWIMNADGTGQIQLTFPPGFNNLANWGVLRVRGNEP
jgi:TolB protein